MSGKYALIIANTEYTDPGLSQLMAPGQDAKEFWRVLSSPEIAGFDDVIMLVNEESYRVAEHIEVFFDKKKPDDLLLLFFSGHGVKDENGSLYLAVKNTNRSRLRSTAIKSDFIRSVMDECRSRRQVLILDCCNSGAFAQGTKAETGGSVGTASAFQGTGYGRVILTASDATQFAWEGDKVIGETQNSLFTHFLIKGLEGEADTDDDGRITLDELYDYTYEKIVNITPKQTPGKWTFKQQGEILLRESKRLGDVKPVPLHPVLVQDLQDRHFNVREDAVKQLIRLMNGEKLGLARSAREALQQVADNDDSRTLSRMASEALEAFRQAEEKAAQELAAAHQAKEQAERLAAQKAEEERLARLETERKVKEEMERLAALRAEEEKLARLEAERKAKEEAERLAAQKAEEERLAHLEAERKAKEEADRLAALKVEEERLAKLEAERLVAQKAEEERLARLEAERKAKEEADRLAALKVEEERLAKLEAERLAAQKAEEERLAKLEAKRKAKEEADRLAALKVEEEKRARILERKAQEEAERLAALKVEEEGASKQKATEQQIIEVEEKEEEALTPAVLIPQAAAVERLSNALPFLSKLPASTTLMFGIGAAVVLVIAGVGIRMFSSPGTSADVETPAVPSTAISETNLSTNVPPTNVPAETISVTATSAPLIVVSGPMLEAGTTDPYVDGSTLVAVSAGEFSMGGNEADNPAHKVTLSDYWIYSTEVTNQQYALCVSLGKCTPPDSIDNLGYSDKKLASDPVTGVTYEQAASYCEFVNGHLPSEAEWEKAAQGKSGSYPWGDAEPTCDLLNFNNCQGGMANVVNYANGASRYGALNMAGNAFEWVADWYDADYYTNSPSENPTGPASGSARSVRSSSYLSPADQVTVATRSSEEPQNHRPDLGFRCVVEDPAHFASFCEQPVMYASADNQETGSLESCPDLEIKPSAYCAGNVPTTDMTFVGPDSSTIDSQNCAPTNNPFLFKCTTNGKTVSMSAACELSLPSESACLPGYTKKDNVCVLQDTGKQSSSNCLAGTYDSDLQCCQLSKESTGPSASLQVCPVGTFYAAKANACLPEPVQEIVTVTQKVALLTSCAPSNSSSKNGKSCQANQAEIASCNANAPFFNWNSSTCKCEAAK